MTWDFLKCHVGKSHVDMGFFSKHFFRFEKIPCQHGAPFPDALQSPNTVKVWRGRYGEAQAAAASWRAHGRRQRGTGLKWGAAVPHLYRYRLTHTYCSLARLPPTHPFVGALILQRHFPSLSPSPPAHSFIIGPAVINTHTHRERVTVTGEREERRRRRRRKIYSYSMIL